MILLDFKNSFGVISKILNFDAWAKSCLLKVTMQSDPDVTASSRSISSFGSLRAVRHKRAAGKATRRIFQGIFKCRIRFVIETN